MTKIRIKYYFSESLLIFEIQICIIRLINIIFIRIYLIFCITKMEQSYLIYLILHILANKHL